jgi:conjugative transfer region protein TrbK
MSTMMFERIPTFAAAVLVVLVVAACAIRLRGVDEQTNTPTSVGGTADPLATKLMGCRSITFEQKDALSDCRKAWAEKRRQFFGQQTQVPFDSHALHAGSSLFVPKDESRWAVWLPCNPADHEGVSDGWHWNH